jgi:small-conductance mechanosensitive channel
MDWDRIFSLINDILNFTLFHVNEAPITVTSLLIFLLFFTGFIFLGIFVRKALNRRILKRLRMDDGVRYTLSRITQYTIIVIGALISFQFIGLNLNSLAVIFGLLSVGIGFGLQNITANFISGLILLFERPISVGDRVMVSQIEGDVIEINIRATKIRTVNNVFIIVPNYDLVSKEVVNYSHGNPTYRLDIDVGVSYSSDLDRVLGALGEVASENEMVLQHPQPQVHLVSFGDSARDMQLRAWIGDVKNCPRVRNELNQAIVRKFHEHDIEIPFPQRDLHVRSTISLPVSNQ